MSPQACGRSPICIMGWFGERSNPSVARWMLRRLYGRELDAERER